MYRLNIVARGIVPKPNLEEAPYGENPKPRSHREVLFDDERTWIETPVFERSEFPRGAAISGPAVIEQLDSTLVVPPWAEAVVDQWGNLRLTAKADER